MVEQMHWVPPPRPERPANGVRAKAAPYNAARTIVASAAKIQLTDRTDVQNANVNNVVKPWQERVWKHYDDVGEVKYAFGVVASILSRLRLYGAVVLDSESVPVRLADAVTIDRPDSEKDDAGYQPPTNGISPDLALVVRDTVTTILGTGTSNMLRNYGLNISVPGECYLIEHRGEWSVRSTSEAQVQSDGKVRLITRANSQMPVTVDKDKITIGRIWKAHPRYSQDADSSMLGVLSDCDELILISKMIRVLTRAKLNAGILFVPDEVTVASKTVTDDQEIEEAEEDLFENELVYAFTESVRDETAANTVVPLLLRGPSELGEKINYIEISRKMDQFLAERADKTLDRILQGIDVPKDIVTGLANVKYSNATQIDDNLYKAHIEPLALVFCDAITDIALRPMLRAKGVDAEDANRIVIWYDPSEIVTRPDRAADALDLYTRQEISGRALRAAYGFSESDAPTEDDLARHLAINSIVPPEIVSILLKWALPDIAGQVSQGGPGGGGAGQLPPDLQRTLESGTVPDQTPVEPTAKSEPAPPQPPAPAEPAQPPAQPRQPQGV